MNTLPRQFGSSATKYVLVLMALFTMFAQVSVGFAAPTMAPKTIVVNPATGKDTNNGSAAAPFKTLKKAFSAVVSGDTITLAAGTYGQAAGIPSSGDTYPLTVPAGIKIVGALNATTPSSILVGSNNTQIDGLVLAGDTTIKNLGITNFRFGLKATTGTQTWTNVLFYSNYQAMSVSGNAQASLLNSTVRYPATNATVVSVYGTARLTVDGGLIEPDAVKCTNFYEPIRAEENAQISLIRGVQIRNAPTTAIAAKGNAKVLIDGALISKDFPAGCSTEYMFSFRERAALTMQNTTAWSTGNTASNGVYFISDGPMVVANSNMTGFSWALNAFGDKNLTGDPTLDVFGSVFYNNGVAIHASTPITVRGTSITKGNMGIMAAQLKLRNSLIDVSDRAVYLRSFGPAGVDLGTAQRPGGNTIIGNTGVYIEKSTATGKGKVNAVGNTWKPNTQGSNAVGRYGSMLVTTPYTSDGGNYMLPSTNFSIQF